MIFTDIKPRGQTVQRKILCKIFIDILYDLIYLFVFNDIVFGGRRRIIIRAAHVYQKFRQICRCKSCASRLFAVFRPGYLGTELLQIQNILFIRPDQTIIFLGSVCKAGRQILPIEIF